MPRRRTAVPPSGSSSPASRRRSVDFPEPFAPTMPTRARGSTAKSRPSSTVRLPKDFRTPFRLRRAIAQALRTIDRTYSSRPSLSASIRRSRPEMPARLVSTL